MASVAICPHCNLQLFIPEHVETDARVQCPTCREAFDLQEAVLRSVPEVVPVDPMTAAAEALEESLGAHLDISTERTLDEIHPELDTADQADENFAAWFKANQTVADVSIPPRTPTLAELWPERAKEVQAIAGVRDTEKIVRTAPAPSSTPSPSPEPALPEHLPLGPSFDLPNVPLAPENKHTVEFGVDSLPEAVAATDFALDDVDLHNQATIAEIEAPVIPAGEIHGRVSKGDPALDAYQTFVVPPPSKRRRRSPVRTLVGATFGGLAGLAVGYYLFLYFLGPQGDFLQVADRVPKWLLPKEFSASPSPPSRIMAAAETGAQSPAPPANDNSTNVQASFETEPAANPTVLPEDKQSSDTQPAGLAQADEPPVTPLPNELPRTIEPPHIAGAPSYSAEQWSTALAAAREAEPGLENGDLSDAAVRRTKGLSYAKFCDLAQMSTFCDANSGGDVEQLDRDTQTLFQSTLANSHTRDEVARIADIWIESPNRRHGGVFITGNLNGGDIAGDVFEYQLSTENASSIVLLLPHPPEGATTTSGHAVAVVGTIVEQPSKNIPGYTGDAPRAIWVSRLIPLN